MFRELFLPLIPGAILLLGFLAGNRIAEGQYLQGILCILAAGLLSLALGYHIYKNM